MSTSGMFADQLYDCCPPKQDHYHPKLALQQSMKQVAAPNFLTLVLHSVDLLELCWSHSCRIWEGLTLPYSLTLPAKKSMRGWFWVKNPTRICITS
eukprot:5294018-Amphidinium_carterae.1